MVGEGNVVAKENKTLYYYIQGSLINVRDKMQMDVMMMMMARIRVWYHKVM